MDFSLADMNGAFGTMVDTVSQFLVTYTLSVIGAIIILIIGFIVAGIVKRWSFKALTHVRSGDSTVAGFLSTLAKYAVLTLVFVMVLSQFGVQTASIIAALGAAGLAIGLALQGTLQNVAAGVVLLFLRPFKVGDFVDCDSVSGVVQEIGLFATEFRTLDGLFVLAPNSEVWGSPVTNFGRNPLRRFDLVIGIGYDDDIDLARSTMQRLADDDERVLTDPEPYIYVSELGDNAVSVTMRVWMKTADWWATSNDLREAGKKAFDAAGLSIPFPQRDVHHYGAPATPG